MSFFHFNAAAAMPIFLIILGYFSHKFDYYFCCGVAGDAATPLEMERHSALKIRLKYRDYYFIHQKLSPLVSGKLSSKVSALYC